MILGIQIIVTRSIPKVVAITKLCVLTWLVVWKKLEEVSDSSTYYVVHTFVVDDVTSTTVEVQSVKKFCGSKFVEKKNLVFF